jgi:MFS family permease
MRTTILSVFSLMLGAAILLIGHGLLGTLLSLRASVENYSGTVVGVIMSAYFAGYIFGTFKGPAMINRIGHIRLFAISASIASALVLLHGLFVEPWLWIITRFIYGACIVIVYLVIESWLNERAGNTHRGQIFSIYTFVTLGALAAGQQFLLFGQVESLELFAICAVLFSISLVPVAWTRSSEPDRVKAPAIDLRKLIATSPVGFAGCLASGFVGGAFWTMSPLFALESGLSETQVAAFMSVPIIGGALFQVPVGLVSDRFDRRNAIIILSTLAAIFALITVFISHIPYALTLCAMFVFGGAYFCIYPLSVAQSNDRANPEDFITLGSTLLLVFGAGAMISPVLTGILIQYFGVESLPIFYVTTLISLAIFSSLQVQTKAAVNEEERGEFTPMLRTSSMAMEITSDDAAQAALHSNQHETENENETTKVPQPE